MSSFAIIRFKKAGVVTEPGDSISIGGTLPYVLEVLHKLASKEDLRSLKDFIFEDPEFYLEMFGEEMPPKVKKQLKTQKEWHTCQEGLDAFEAMLSVLKAQKPKVLETMFRGTRVSSDAATSELKAIAELLKAGAKRKDQFRIEPDVSNS